MSIRNENRNYLLVTIALFMSVALMSLTGVAAAETEASDADGRMSKTLHFEQGGRSNDRDASKGNLTVDEYRAIERRTGTVQRSNKATAVADSTTGQQSTSFDFWIYDADVVLFSDDDNDGYFYGIDLLFDADTIYGSADVYAAVYLSYEGGPWNEYSVTEDFTIFGSSGTDEYVLVTELMAGYPTGDYDLLIELFDAFDGSFVASYGPDDNSGLSYLPLEDFNRDAPVEETRVVVTRGGGGSIALWMLLALAGARIARRHA